MLRDITIGQYYPGKSIIHRLDPRTKLLGGFLFIISAFLIDGIWTFLLATFFLVVAIGLSKIPVKYVLKGLKPIFFLLLFTALFNIFLTPGRMIWSYGIFKITYEGVNNSVYMIIRLTYLAIGASISIMATTPNQLTDGLEVQLRFLNVLHVPVHEVAMMMSIALRFIPILIEETDKIMKAQIARGADFEKGNIFKKAKNMIPLLVPLIVSAWRRSTDLAMAMEARCYRGGKGRTKMYPLHYQVRDGISYVILGIYMAGMVTMKILF